MKFTVFRMRDHGKVVPRFLRFSRPTVGHLDVSSATQSDLNRVTKVAKLLDDQGLPLSDPPPMCDVTLVEARQGWWTMTGFERISNELGHDVDYAQSWILIPVGEE